ncbi:MAG: protein kinase [Chloroflexota bacterium]
MDQDLIGQIIDGFEILSLIGSGGMASVYRAHQADLDRIVALKVLSPALAHDPQYVARFQQEARSIAALEHPHIVPVYAVGAIHERPYIVMKCIDGTTLKDVVQERNAPDLSDMIPTLEQVASAIDYAHSKSVIHRDIKPSNILIEQNNWAYLVDFGLARSTNTTQGLTLAHTIMGTPEYMSPEQAQGTATIGTPTDIYSFGMVVYELLTGRIPFDSDTPMGMLVARLQYAPLPPSEYRNDIPPAIEEIIMRALARRPEARFATASELILALQQAAGIINKPSSIQPQMTPQFSETNETPTVTMPTTRTSEGAQTIVSDLDEPALLVTPPPTSLQPDQALGTSQVLSAPRQFSIPRWALASIGIAVLLIAITIGVAFFDNTDEQIEQLLQDADIALTQRGGIIGSIEAYEEVLDIDPEHTTAHTQLALIHNLRGAHEQAEQSARNAIRSEASYALPHALLAEARLNQGYTDEALEATNRAVELDPDLAIGYSTRAIVLSEQALEENDKQLLEQAIDDADVALDIAQNEDNLALAMAYSSQGYVYWQEYLLTGDTVLLERSKAAFEQALALQDYMAIFHVNLGYLYDAQKQHELARDYFDEAIAIDSAFGSAYAGLGWSYYATNEYPQALTAFDEAIVHTPHQVEAYIGKSQVYRDQAVPDYNSAIETLQTATQMAPQQERVLVTLGWVYRDQALRLAYGTDEQRRRYVDAEESFRQALVLQPVSVDAMTGLGWVLQEKGRLLGQRRLYQESVQILQTSLDTRDDQPYAYAALGWSKYHLGDFDGAHNAFQQATQLLPEYADAYYGLGLTLEAQGQIEQAKAIYEDGVDYGSAHARDELARLK